MESTPVHRSTSSLRGAGGRGGPSADAERGGHPNARTHASVTTGCSGRVESGLCSSFSSPEARTSEYFLDLGAPGRCLLARALERERRRSQPRCSRFTPKGEKAVEDSVTGFGQPTREARSYRAVSLLFVSCCRSRTTTSRPKKLESLRRPGERGLAQSGRPRRAKGRRTASRGGKTADSSTRKAGARKGIAGLSASSRWKASRVVEAVLSSRGEWGKRSRPSWCSSSRERDGQTSEATETSEVGRSKIKFRIHAPMRWRKPTAGSASGSPKRMERRETHQAPASIGRKLGAQSVTERSDRFSKVCVVLAFIGRAHL